MEVIHAGAVGYDGWRSSTSEVTYEATDKEPPQRGMWEETRKGDAYWMLAGRIKDRFGDKPVTTMEIYREVTGPLGLSTSDTIQLVRGAKKQGYLV